MKIIFLVSESTRDSDMLWARQSSVFISVHHEHVLTMSIAQASG